MIYILRLIDETMIKLLTRILLIFTAIFITFLIISNKFTYTGSYKLTALEFSHVIAARLIAPVCIIALYLLSTATDKKEKNKLFLYACYFNTGLLFTAHRASVIGVLLITIFFVVKGKNKTYNTLAILIPFFLTLIIFPSKLDRYKELSPENYKENYSIVSRLELWSIALEKIKMEPITGHGLGGFKCSNKFPIVHIYKYPHNLFLEVQCEMGVLGTLFILFLIYKILISAYRTSPLLFSIALLSLWWSLFSKDITTQTLLFINIAFIK
ncbi:O-antigen ligase family protein [Melioribacter sp. OK-6-Me]|uniref:O-antigen ligase family protein n=1 Tax=Melioribacter sp. OK-6-Me TaxID=3423433 RepID=UPI003F5CEC39